MRAEFTKPTKRSALSRSGGFCEAVGPWYGLDEGKRCNMPLATGVEFDHVILDANSKDNSLGNCLAVCPKCHVFKTRKIDIPTAAKTVRQKDKNAGIRRDGKKLVSRPLPKSEKRSAIDKSQLGELPKRELYR